MFSWRTSVVVALLLSGCASHPVVKAAPTAIRIVIMSPRSNRIHSRSSTTPGREGKGVDLDPQLAETLLARACGLYGDGKVWECRQRRKRPR